MFSGGDLIWGISWIWYLIGILGVGGTIAFFVVDAAAATLFFRALIGWLWKTRIGWALVAGFFMFEIADIHRSRSDEAAFAERTSEFEQKQKDRDVKIAQDTRVTVLRELADAKQADTTTDTQVQEFHDDKPPVPALNNPFRVGTDADRLRRIAGAPVGGSGSAKGVSKAGKVSSSSGHHSRFRLPRPFRASPRPNQQGQPGH
jgi:hypothetical protein